MKTVRTIADGLGFKGRGEPGEFVVAHCRRVVGGWISLFEATTLDELLATICAKVGLIIEEIWEDADLDEISRRYMAEGELGFARVEAELDDHTYALVFRLHQNIRGNSHVAVIDCRGPKSRRRWFSIWHEVAHLVAEPQLSFAFRKCEAGKDPVESLMDTIAGELGFHPDMYPSREVAESLPGLQDWERQRLEHAEEASRSSAFGTAASRSAHPVMLVAARRRQKKGVERALADGKPVSDEDMEPQLRVQTVVASDGARTALPHVPKNYRVPATSVLSWVFENANRDLEDRTWVADENLRDWTSSSNRLLPDCPVHVEAGKSGKWVFGLISPR